MCVVSMVMDHYKEKWEQYANPASPVLPLTPYVPGPYIAPLPISPSEIEEFRKLLERARECDKQNNEPDCELDEKREAVKKIAKQLGVKISFI